MGRFATRNWRADDYCPKHGDDVHVTGVAPDSASMAWTWYCEECAADLIAHRLRPIGRTPAASAPTTPPRSGG